MVGLSLGKMGKYRNWCFTSFMVDLKYDVEKVEYIIYQQEKCKNGKKHWQGYVEFRNQKRMSEVKLVFGDDTIHVEPRHGTQEQAIDYCKKSESKIGDCVTYGKPKRQGNRSDLDSIYDAIESGMTAKEILREFRGHGMRYITQIIKCLEIEYECAPIDMLIKGQRLLVVHNLDASEVGGNTDPPTSDDIED